MLSQTCQICVYQIVALAYSPKFYIANQCFTEKNNLSLRETQVASPINCEDLHIATWFPTFQDLFLSFRDTDRQIKLIQEESSHKTSNKVTGVPYWRYYLGQKKECSSKGYLPGDSKMVLSLATGPDDDVTLVHVRLHKQHVLSFSSSIRYVLYVLGRRPHVE